MRTIRNLILVLGDQLTLENPALANFDKTQDIICMAEVVNESTKVTSHKTRTVYFLSAMRHFKQELEASGYPVYYQTLEESVREKSFNFKTTLTKTIHHYQPKQILFCHPGEYNVLEEIKTTCDSLSLPYTVFEDTHFVCSIDQFKTHANERKQLRMEFFYREMRKQTNLLMNGRKPEKDQWNFDHDNRQSFGKQGPQNIPEPITFMPDEITQQVIQDVEQYFEKHPGNLKNFDWPVTRKDALKALNDFIENRLSQFGPYQDALWQSENKLTEISKRASIYFYHSRLSACLNLKLLNPLEVCKAAEIAYKQGKVTIKSCEGFIRQIIGWREYVRGIYWLKMPQYIELNALNAKEELPQFYWTGQTDMACLSSAIGQTLEYGYAHHIQRLMITGLFALLLGVNPKWVHQWYLAIYVDAVEWVELPNTLGMSQYGDGGSMASKPYIATGKYIDRMSNHCKNCRYNPNQKTGDDACPFTTLYWDFLMRHEVLLKKNQRMALQVRNILRLSHEEKLEITHQAQQIKLKLNKI